MWLFYAYILYMGFQIKNAVESGEALKNPNVLTAFLLVTFADLKMYKFYYWFAFPAIMPQLDPWMMSRQMEPINKVFTDDQVISQFTHWAMQKKMSE